jgi:hypothetical protein
VIVTSRITPSTNNVQGYMSFSATGVAASDNQALGRAFGNAATGGFIQASASFLVTGLTAGSLAFTAKYRTSAGTSTFQNRNIIVIPMP